jgi:hypothetical protein
MARRIAVLLGAVTLGALAVGCDGGGGTLDPPPDRLNVAGNWQFSTTSAVAGRPPLSIAGNITQTSSSISGAVHVDGSSCFDQQTTIDLTGTLADSNLTLTSASIDGQVIRFTGRITDNTLAGTYATNGGCANGDQGSVGGFKLPVLDGRWTVKFDSRSEERWTGVAMLTQGSAGPEGSLGITGTVDVNLRCFSGTIGSGAFPSPSFIMGDSVALTIETGEGTLVFGGTVNEAGTSITGSHHVVGGSCDGEFGRGTLGRQNSGF